MRVAEVQDGQIVGGPMQAPQTWRGTTFSTSARPDTYRRFGLWPVEVDDPGAGPWEQESGRSHTVDTEREVVVETVQYALVPVDERKAAMQGQAREQFQAALASGFADSDEITWAATDDARARVLDLTQRIQEHRAGKAASALPNGKSAVKLRDASNTPHDVGPDKIVALAEQGSDFKDAAEDRLEQLVAEINAAASHDDLDQIDVTSGWP